MNLFTTLSDVLGNGCTATITIAQKDGIMTVGVLPGNDLVKDAAKNSIVPRRYRRANQKDYGPPGGYGCV